VQTEPGLLEAPTKLRIGRGSIHYGSSGVDLDLDLYYEVIQAAMLDVFFVMPVCQISIRFQSQ
jgi:hypothetical protein